MSDLTVRICPPGAQAAFSTANPTPNFRYYLQRNYHTSDRGITHTVRLTQPLRNWFRLAQRHARTECEREFGDLHIASAAVEYPAQHLITEGHPLWMDNEPLRDQAEAIIDGELHPDDAPRWTGPRERTKQDDWVKVKIRPSRWEKIKRLMDGLGCSRSVALRHLMAYSFLLYDRSYFRQCGQKTGVKLVAEDVDRLLSRAKTVG